MKTLTLRCIAICLSLLCWPSLVLAAAQTHTFDFQRKCASERVLEQLVSLPINTQPSAALTGLTEFEVNQQTMRGKTANAHKQLRLIEEFFASELSWQSVDGQSAPLILLGNLSTTFDNKPCNGMNAFYANLSADRAHVIAILYGHPEAPEDLANDIEVMGHEFSHGLFTATQGRTQLLEKRAINEGVADMFGVAIRAWYESGKDLSQTRVRQDSFHIGRTYGLIADRYYQAPMREGLMRNLTNPLPWDTADHYDLRNQQEFQEVHALSGVVSLPFTLLVNGGRHPRVDNGIEVSGIGFKKSVEILFYTLKNRLPFQTMPEFAQAMLKASRKIHGNGSHEYRQVEKAFATTGLLTVATPPAAPSEAPPASPPSPPASQPAPSQQPSSQPPPPQPQAPGPAPSATPEPAPAESEAEATSSPQSNPVMQVSGPTFVMIFLSLLLLMVITAMVLKNRRRQQLQQTVVSPVASTAAEVASFPAPAPAPAPAPVTPAAAGGCSVSMTIADVSVVMSLGEQPQILGRSRQLGLPTELSEQLNRDDYIGREHCKIWLDPTLTYFYVYCLSANGLSLNGQALSGDDKAKAEIATPLMLQIGQTQIGIRVLRHGH